jgi:transposase
MQITTIGVDLAKHVFQLHGIGPDGRVVLRQKLRRGQMITFFAKLPPCLVGMEACATAHHWARELRALGHQVRLMPAHYVKAYIKRGKNDAADAEAICEAVTRPTMRFVAIKTKEQQAVLVMHRTRELLVRQRTQTINALRGLLGEFGICEPQGIWHLGRLRAHLEDDTVPEPGRKVLSLLVEQLNEVEKRIAQVEAEIRAWHRSNPVSQRLAKIPGIGPLTASAIAATVPDASLFRSGREFAAWLGLAPRQKSTGGKQRLGRITHQGDAYIRRLLIIGAQSALQRSKEVRENAWVQRLLGRCARLKVAVALANKTARIAWALMRNGRYLSLGGCVSGISQGARAEMLARGRGVMERVAVPTYWEQPGTYPGFSNPRDR